MNRVVSATSFRSVAVSCAVGLALSFAWATSVRASSQVQLSAQPASRATAVSGPLIVVSPPSLNFGTTAVGIAADLLLTIQNPGEQTLTVTNAQSSDPHFTTSFTVPLSIPAGSQQNITVSYLPTMSSMNTGSLTLFSNAGLKVVPMTGTGASQPNPGRVLIAPGGAAPGDQFGNAVSTAGDVNGDGFDDVIIGSWGSDANGGDAGRAYVFLGGSTPSPTPAVILNGQAFDDHFGTSVAGGADVNDDGYDDVLVGAYTNDAAQNDAGRAYLYFGGPSMDAVADLIFTGEPVPSGGFGVSVSMAGDVNGDGFADVIVGAFGARRAYVYFGGTAMNNTADLILDEGATLYGWSVSGAGDVNADGFADMVVGAPQDGTGGVNAGRAFVYFGKGVPDASADWVITGTAGERRGIHVASAGKVNGDAYGDIIVGADYNSAGGIRAGRAYVFHGGIAPDTTPDLVLSGDSDFGEFGEKVCTAGDVNADGYDDVFVSAWRHRAAGVGTGRAYVFLGGPSADTVPDYTFTGEAEGDNLGSGVASVGDMDGDGGVDLVIGAYFNDFTAEDAGRAYVVSVSSPSSTHPPVLTVPASVLASEGALVAFTLQTTDPDGDAVTIGALNRPVGSVLVDLGTGSAQFSWTPGYDQAGSYTVTFTARDEHGANADAKQVAIMVDNVNRAPSASPGGPYVGVVNQPITFAGTGSADPDGDALTYHWSFGDGATGVGPNPAHAYGAGGTYTVALQVSDGTLSNTASTTTTIQDVFQANAFLEGGNKTTKLGSGKATTCAQIEPKDGAYANSSIVGSSIVMISTGTGSLDRISAIEAKATFGVDKDRNGIDEITACFRKEDMRLLFANLTGGKHLVGVALEGDLTSGGRFHTTLEMEVVVSGGGQTVSVSPNPLNPSATLTYRTTQAGPVAIMVYDLSGRMVRTLARDSFVSAGYHDVKVDGAGDNGARLASGVYFYRVESADGVASGRFVIMK